MDAGFTRPVARITGVSHRYGATTALGNVSLELPSGRMIGLIGPDGAGKSTLLGLIAGARKLQAGSVDVFDGSMGYAWSLSSFTSTIPRFNGQRVVIDGMSRFIVRDGLIAEYRESVNGGVAMSQLGVEPERMAKVFKRWTGWLIDRPETQDYLARPKGSRAKS